MLTLITGLKSNEKVSGLLLYAKTSDDIQPDHDYYIQGHSIAVKTVDLNQGFFLIYKELINIAEIYL